MIGAYYNIRKYYLVYPHVASMNEFTEESNSLISDFLLKISHVFETCGSPQN
jgi:hypothetical protein